MKKIAIGVSGGGTTFEAIAKAIKAGDLNIQIAFVFCDRDCGAEIKARSLGVKVVKKREDEPIDGFHRRVIALAKKDKVNLIALAGYLRLFPIKKDDSYIVLNSHPGAIPYFGGAGFWGIRVHKVVLEYAKKTDFIHPYTYSTIHIASPEYDKGPVVGIWPMEIAHTDKAENIASRLLSLEHQNYIKVLTDFSRGEMKKKEYPTEFVRAINEKVLAEVRAEVLKAK